METKVWKVKHENNKYVLRNNHGTYLVKLVNEQHANRLCNMINDTPAKIYPNWREIDHQDNWRICSALKVFCMQENLTWADCDLDPSAIRNINSVLEGGNPFERHAS